MFWLKPTALMPSVPFQGAVELIVTAGSVVGSVTKLMPSAAMPPMSEFIVS